MARLAGLVVGSRRMCPTNRLRRVATVSCSAACPAHKQWNQIYLVYLVTLFSKYSNRFDRSSDGWAKNQLGERCLFELFFLGDIRLGDKLGRYGDSKSDGWATFSDGWAKCMKEQKLKTRSQAVARIADRTASQHLWGHVTSSVTWPFDSLYTISYWWSFGTKPLSLAVSEIFNVVEYNAMVDLTLIRPLNKGQGHSFWYQSISHIRLPIGCQYFSPNTQTP